jgi:hypothetical protein
MVKDILLREGKGYSSEAWISIRKRKALKKE